MITIVSFTESDEGPGVRCNILSFFPNKTDTRGNLRGNGYALQVWHKRQHGGEEKAAALALAHKFLRCGDLT